MARRVVRTRFVRPPRKTKVWFIVTTGTVALPASTCTLVSVLNAAALAFRPFTLLRSRIECLYSTDQSSAAETPHGALGMIRVNDKAAALGITAIPCPISNADDDFVIWQGMMAKFEFTTGTGYRDIGTHYEINSKGMRKVDAGDNLAIVFEQGAAVGAQLVMNGRMLIQVH